MKTSLKNKLHEESGEISSVKLTPDEEQQEQTVRVSIKQDATLQSNVVAIAKTAAFGLERLDLLKKKDYPTYKSANAVASIIENLELVFNDMLRNPTEYLDQDPEQLVSDYESSLEKQ